MKAVAPKQREIGTDERGYWSDLQFSEAQAAPAPYCPTCGGAGFIRAVYRKNGQVVGRDYIPCNNPNCPVIHENTVKRNDSLYKTAAIPAEYQDLSFERWQKLRTERPDLATGKLDALGAALAFTKAASKKFFFDLDEAASAVGLPVPEDLSKGKCSIVFSGANGVGKTSLAVSIARELLAMNTQVVYMRFSEFFDGLKERFDKKPLYQYFPTLQSETEVMTHFQYAPVLILDEFYADVTDWRRERAEQLINYRYTHQMPTIITTNLDADSLISLWGMTTGHRIQAMTHWFQVTGQELRSRAGMVKSR